MGKFIERRDDKGRVTRFPYSDIVGVPRGYVLVEEAPPDTTPVIEHRDHPITERKSPTDDAVEIGDHADIKVSKGKKYKVKG